MLLVVFTALMGVTAVVRFVFPSTAAAVGWRLWGGTLDDWIGWQFGLVAALTFLVVLHLMLHWTWVCGVIANRLSQSGKQVIRFDDGQRTLLGVGLLVLILNLIGILIGLAVLTIQGP